MRKFKMFKLFMLLGVTTILFQSLFVVNTNAAGVRYLDQIFTDSNILITNDIVYKTTNNMKLDLYRPNSSVDTVTQRPLLFWVHSGGFTGGDKSEGYNIAMNFAKCGYVVSSVNYTLGDASTCPAGTDTWNYLPIRDPALVDEADALAYLINNATTYGIDTSKIIIGGFSAGGVSAGWLCYDVNSKLIGKVTNWQSRVIASINDSGNGPTQAQFNTGSRMPCLLLDGGTGDFMYQPIHDFQAVLNAEGVRNTLQEYTCGHAIAGFNTSYVIPWIYNNTVIGGGGSIYEAESGTVGNGATIASDSNASGGQCVQNMHLSGAYDQIGNINGGSGGSRTLNIIYAANGTGTLSVYVNGTLVASPSFPTTGGWSIFTGNLQQTITLNSGTGNTIKLVGGNGGINLDYILISGGGSSTPTPTPTATPTPTPGGILFQTGLESGNTQPTWGDTIEVSSNVTGYLSGINPECSVRAGETSHTGSASLMFSGTDNNATTSFCYFKVFDVNIPITSATKLSYWFYPQMALAQGVTVDFVCTDGTTLRDSGAVDQNGISMHPGNNRGTVNTWNQVQCNVGQWLNGKTIDRILVGYDYGPSTGQFRGYIDDILINN